MTDAPTQRIETDVFHLDIDASWVRQEVPGAPFGTAAFRHRDTGFSLFQTVGSHEAEDDDARKAVIMQVMSERLDTLQGNGHAVEPGKIAFDARQHGPLGVSDVILDSERYGVMAVHAMPGLAVVHFVDGPVGQEEAVREAMRRIADTVRYRGDVSLSL